MQTCSNCGATSRDGAKFCTTCGSRLNEVIDSDSPSGWQSFSDTEETSLSPAVTDDAVAEETGEVDTNPTEEPTVATTSWTWGQSTEAVPEATEIESEAESEVEAISTDSESLSSWANQWSDPVIEEENPVSEPEYEVTSDVDEFLDSAEEVAEEPEVVDVPEVESVDESAAVAAAVTIPELTVDTEDSPTPKARAQALIYELRELIDESFDAPTAPAEADSPSGGVDALATLNEVPSENGQFDNLREILERAREQPRDVDTMLNLLGEINSLIALVDSHEQLLTAVEAAKRQLS